MAVSWIDQKKDFEERYSAISSYIQTSLSNDVSELSKATSSYIAKGGISQDPAAGDYNNIIQISAKINKNKQLFQQLNNDISKAIHDISTKNDMGKLLLDNGNLQQKIHALEKEKRLSEQDAETATLRDSLLRSRDSNVTKHQLFLLGRPLRSASIPYIWSLSVLFIGLGLLLFQQMSPIPNIFAQSVNTGIQAQTTLQVIMGFLGDARVWGALSGALSIAVIILSLKVVNII